MQHWRNTFFIYVSSCSDYDSMCYSSKSQRMCLGSLSSTSLVTTYLVMVSVPWLKKCKPFWSFLNPQLITNFTNSSAWSIFTIDLFLNLLPFSSHSMLPAGTKQNTSLSWDNAAIAAFNRTKDGLAKATLHVHPEQKHLLALWLMLPW